MELLNLPKFQFKVKMEGRKQLIFDTIRKKYVVLTPEEWVRQNFIRFLIDVKGYPASFIAVEKRVNVNLLPQRSDIVLYNRQLEPQIIVECKAPHVKISQAVFNQITRYNMVLRVPLLIVTNGLKHYCCRMNYENQTFCFLEDIPAYKSLF